MCQENAELTLTKDESTLRKCGCIELCHLTRHLCLPVVLDLLGGLLQPVCRQDAILVSHDPRSFLYSHQFTSQITCIWG